MPRKIPISTDKAPASAAGLYNQAVVVDGLVYCSGALPVDVLTGKLISDSVQMRTHQCIQNLEHVLHAAGASINDVVKVTVLLTDMKDFAAMNEAYKQYWVHTKPSRTCFAVKQLPMDANIEIECIATIPRSKL